MKAKKQTQEEQRLAEGEIWKKWGSFYLRKILKKSSSPDIMEKTKRDLSTHLTI